MKIKNLSLVFLIIALGSFQLMAQNKMPEMNAKIIKYVKKVKDTKVDRGECWDLAYQALTRVGATWDGQFVYGTLVDPTKDEIFPGDLIQFKNVKIKYTVGNTTHMEEMAQHTAIVYKVLDKGVYNIAHQNTGFSGRKVGISKLDISTVTDGEMKFYRPTK